MASRAATAVLVIGVAVVAGGVAAFLGRGPARVAVDAGTASRQATFRSTATASGEIVATRYADIGSSVMGNIVSLPVAEGDRATFTPVTTGVIGGLDIEVPGLAEGATVIVGPYQALRELQDGDTDTVVGELEKRRGGFFGENRQDSVLNLPAGTVRNRFGDPERVVLYIQAQPGQREECFRQTEAILRLLRKLPPAAENDFSLSTADQIIATFDGLSARIGLVTVALAGVSLLIGAIGIANVMFISVTERTREIGLRLAVGARRRQVLVQFLLEAAFLSSLGGIAGVATALVIGLLLTFVVTGFSAVPPLWAIVTAVAASTAVGVTAGYWPARRAAALDPVAALRHE
jgi:multidrug efflux pump subunit AcrA (membrane-fusion protein)